MSTFVYRVSSVTGTPNQHDVFDALDTKLKTSNNLVDKYLACVTHDYVLLQIWYQTIAPGRFAKYPVTAVGKIGAFTGESQTANLAAVITRRGDLGNRHNVSTLHVPIGTDDNSMEDGELTVDLKAVMDALAIQMNSSITLSSPVTGLAPVINNGPNANDYSPITNTFTGDHIRVMRRRTLSLGQ
jgi:hypothetical protein